MVFVRKELFGGALTAELPAGYVDVSSVRDVPDNQEVFSQVDSDRSLIVEILDYENDLRDADAARYFFEDLAGANGASETIVESNALAKSAQIAPLVRAEHEMSAAVLVGRQKVAKFRESAKNDVRIYLANLRLPKYQADVLVTLNAPVAIDPASSSAPSAANPCSAAEDQEVFDRFLKTLAIVNPGLFGG